MEKIIELEQYIPFQQCIVGLVSESFKKGLDSFARPLSKKSFFSNNLALTKGAVAFPLTFVALITVWFIGRKKFLEYGYNLVQKDDVYDEFEGLMRSVWIQITNDHYYTMRDPDDVISDKFINVAAKLARMGIDKGQNYFVTQVAELFTGEVEAVLPEKKAPAIIKDDLEQFILWLIECSNPQLDVLLTE